MGNSYIEMGKDGVRPPKVYTLLWSYLFIIMFMVIMFMVIMFMVIISRYIRVHATLHVSLDFPRDISEHIAHPHGFLPLLCMAVKCEYHSTIEINKTFLRFM